MTETSSAPAATHSSKLPGLFLMLLAFLIPVLIIPLPDFPIQLTKEILTLIGVAIIVVLTTVKVIQSRSFSFPLSLSLASLALLPVCYFLSAMFAPVPALSLWGYQLETDTFGFILLGSALALSVVLAMPPGRQIFSVLAAFFFGGLVVVAFQLIQLFLGGPLPLDLFSSPTINLVGSWSGLGVFLGLFASLLLIALESLPLSGGQKWLLRAVLLASLFLLVVINLKEVWAAVGVVAFAALVHALTLQFRTEGKSPSRGLTSGAILLVALFFLYTGSPENPSISQNLSLSLQGSFGIQTLDVRPSAEGTLTIAQATYSKSPFFGSGPNTFGADWLLHRAPEIVGTPFWGVAFPSGFASIPTAVATGGLVVAFAWLFLAAAFFLAIGKALLARAPHDRSYFLLTVSAVGSLYLLVMHLAYVPDASLTLLMFLFLGLFLSSLVDAGLMRSRTVSLVENPRLGFLIVLLGIAVSFASVVSVYGGGVVYASNLSYQSSLRLSGTGDLEGAKSAVTSAIRLSQQDRYYRTLASIEVLRLNAIAGGTLSDSEKQSQFRETLSSAINAAVEATRLDPGNYYNWLLRSSVYGSVVPLKIEGAYESAAASLEEARARNPQTPEVDFQLAQMKAALGDREGARASAAAALQKKSDYTSAILFLADLSLSEGKLSEAITSVEAVAFLDPGNSQLLYQLGLLKLQNKDYAGAKDAFLGALKVNPEYANASFFLGQAQFLLGDTQEALATFKSIKETNEDNETLKSVIAALEEGKDPFASSPETTRKTPTE